MASWFWYCCSVRPVQMLAPVPEHHLGKKVFHPSPLFFSLSYVCESTNCVFICSYPPTTSTCLGPLFFSICAKCSPVGPMR